MNVHQIRRLLYEEDEYVWCLSTEKKDKTKENAVNANKILKLKNT